jgi:hypothetical protein
MTCLALRIIEFPAASLGNADLRRVPHETLEELETSTFYGPSLTLDTGVSLAERRRIQGIDGTLVGDARDPGHRVCLAVVKDKHEYTLGTLRFHLRNKGLRPA